MTITFRDRTDAGHQLAGRLAGRIHGDVVVLGLPRGGVPVAARVARTLDAPLDVIIVRKLGVPFHREYAMGAIGEQGVRVLDESVLDELQIGEDQVAAVEAEERAELERRARRYRRGQSGVSLEGRTAVIVDDGMATGSTAIAACRVARLLGAGRVVLAVPVASSSAVEELRDVADEVVCLHIPPQFRAVGEWYEDFAQTSDAEVESVLEQQVQMGSNGAPFSESTG
jgi:putative phosphoribosyl transferase